MFAALFAGYPIYALIAAFTSITLVPDTLAEVLLLGGLTLLAVVGKAMDHASEQRAREGDPLAIKYRRDWGLDRGKIESPMRRWLDHDDVGR